VYHTNEKEIIKKTNEQFQKPKLFTLQNFISLGEGKIGEEIKRHLA
jgi:hypothetical protein